MWWIGKTREGMAPDDDDEQTFAGATIEVEDFNVGDAHYNVTLTYETDASEALRVDVTSVSGEVTSATCDGRR